jgi:hypothetical protein
MATPTNAPMLPLASKHGVFLGLALIALQTLFYLADIRLDSGLGYITYAVLIIGLFLSIRHYRDLLNEGYINYGRAVGYGVLVALLAGIISSLFTFVLYQFIDPNLIGKLLLESEEKLLESGMAEDQLDMAMEMNKKIITPGFLTLMGILGQTFMGLVFSLVLAVFLKKEGSSFEKDTL